MRFGTRGRSRHDREELSASRRALFTISAAHASGALWLDTTRMTEDHPFRPHPPMPLAESYRLALGIQRPDPRGCDFCREALFTGEVAGGQFPTRITYTDPQGVEHVHAYTKDGH